MNRTLGVYHCERPALAAHAYEAEKTTRRGHEIRKVFPRRRKAYRRNDMQADSPRRWGRLHIRSAARMDTLLPNADSRVMATIHHRIGVAATRERVFAYLVEPEKLTGWWAVTVERGKTLRLGFAGLTALEFEIVECQPPGRSAEVQSPEGVLESETGRCGITRTARRPRVVQRGSRRPRP